jgi:hypothetical protein
MTTRMLVLATLATVGCHIHLHVALPPDEAAQLRASLQTKEAPPATAPAQMTTITMTQPHRHAAKLGARSAPCPLEDAQVAYVLGDYVGALQQAVRNNRAGWRIIAATGCALQDEAWVSRAAGNLNMAERAWLRDVCRRHGVDVVGIDSDHPRAVRTADFEEESD